MQNFTPITSLLGGALIGLGAALVLLGIGRIAGVSGILGGILVPRSGDIAWRIAFMLGLVAGGVVMGLIDPALFAVTTGSSLLTVSAAGLLVGFGTRMGDGCTSGHGVCGLSRGSPRSLVATMTFMVTAGLTVFLVRHVLGGNP